MISEQVIQQAVHRLVAAANPSRIILFGSYATGTATENSDLDLMVIKRSVENVRYIYQLEDNFMVVDDVPCLECDYCSEQYFDASVLKKIERDFMDVSKQRKLPVSSMQVAVESFLAL